MKIDWDEIRKEWEGTDKTYKELEEQFGVKSATIRSRRSREKWEHYTVADEKKRVAKGLPPKRKKATSKRMKRRSGNPNPKNQFAKRNKAAWRHGFFAQYLPKKTMELVERIDELDPVEILWDQITIQYAAIMQAQEVMHVTSQDDHDTFVIEEGEYGTKKEVHASWDKQAKLLTSQSRAMAELRGLIKQYVAIADESDERRLKLESMQLAIQKTKHEIDVLEKGNDDKPLQIEIVRKGEDDGET